MRSNTKALAVIFAVSLLALTFLMMAIGGVSLSLLGQAVVLAYAQTSAFSICPLPEIIARGLVRDSGEYEKQA